MNIEVLAALQAAKGTEKTDIMSKLSATDYGVLPSVDKKVSEALGSGRWVRDGFVSKISVAGDVPVELTMDQLEILLAGAGFEGKVTGTDYVMTSGASIDKYLTIGVNDLDSDMFEYSKDCQISSLALNVQLEIVEELPKALDSNDDAQEAAMKEKMIHFSELLNEATAEMVTAAQTLK